MSRDQQQDAPQNHESLKRPQQEAYQFLDTPPSQTWRTLLRNHLGEIGAVDFFTVPNDSYASAVRFSACHGTAQTNEVPSSREFLNSRTWLR